jgi:hypothetical protein
MVRLHWFDESNRLIDGMDRLRSKLTIYQVIQLSIHDDVGSVDLYQRNASHLLIQAMQK